MSPLCVSSWGVQKFAGGSLPPDFGRHALPLTLLVDFEVENYPKAGRVLDEIRPKSVRFLSEVRLKFLPYRRRLLGWRAGFGEGASEPLTFVVLSGITGLLGRHSGCRAGQRGDAGASPDWSRAFAVLFDHRLDDLDNLGLLSAWQPGHRIEGLPGFARRFGCA